MARSSPNLTLKATGKLNKGSINRLTEVINLQRELYNHSLDWLEHRPETDFNTLRDILRKELTQLRKEDPNYRNILLNVSDGTIQRAITNHLRHATPKEGSEPAGKPRRKTPERFRTITLLSPDNKVIFPNSTESKLKLKAKGLPNITLKSSQTIPNEQQPNTVHITFKHGAVLVRLVYDQPAQPTLKPKKLVMTAVGIDVGNAITVATSLGINYHSPNESELESQIKKTQRTLQKKIASAIRNGLCGFKAVLDEENKQLLTSRDKPRRELVWLQAPTKSYLKARQQLSRLYDRRNKLRRDFRHCVTSAIVQMALEQEIDLIAVENLNILNMTASARGTEKNPGRNVRAKSGLNRSILQQGWGEIIEMLRYKARKARIRFISVWAGRSSQTCNVCQAVDPLSRVIQADFTCTSCGHHENADSNASKVIAQRGLSKLKEPSKTPA